MLRALPRCKFHITQLNFSPLIFLKKSTTATIFCLKLEGKVAAAATRVFIVRLFSNETSLSFGKSLLDLVTDPFSVEC